jgi:hypothetical protein
VRKPCRVVFGKPRQDGMRRSGKAAAAEQLEAAFDLTAAPARMR